MIKAAQEDNGREQEIQFLRLNLTTTHKIRRQLDQFRIEQYRHIIEIMEPNDPGLWKATKYITKKNVTIPTLTVNDVKYEMDEEKCNIFAEHLENVFTPSLLNETIIHSVRIIAYNESYQPVTPAETKRHIKELSIRKAPGNDLIPNILLVNLTKRH